MLIPVPWSRCGSAIAVLLTLVGCVISDFELMACSALVSVTSFEKSKKKVDEFLEKCQVSTQTLKKKYTTLGVFLNST